MEVEARRRPKKTRITTERRKRVKRKTQQNQRKRVKARMMRIKMTILDTVPAAI